MIRIIRKIFIKTSSFFKKKLSILTRLCHKKEKEIVFTDIQRVVESENLNEIPIKVKGKKMHKLTKKEEVKGGKDSHKGHKMLETEKLMKPGKKGHSHKEK